MLRNQCLACSGPQLLFVPHIFVHNLGDDTGVVWRLFTIGKFRQVGKVVALIRSLKTSPDWLSYGTIRVTTQQFPGVWGGRCVRGDGVAWWSGVGGVEWGTRRASPYPGTQVGSSQPSWQNVAFWQNEETSGVLVFVLHRNSRPEEQVGTGGQAKQ